MLLKKEILSITFWCVSFSGIIFYTLSKYDMLRVTKEEENIGQDISSSDIELANKINLLKKSGLI